MNQPSQEQPGARKPSRLGVLLFRVLPPLLLVSGLVGAVVLIKTAPKPERKQPPPMQSLVKVSVPEVTDQPILVRAMGEVIPAREVMLKAQVSGEVTWTHERFREGARFKQGAVMVNIDPSDYEIARAKAQSLEAQANFDYQREQGYQDVARREWGLLKEEGRPASEREEYLALRKPQLANVEAGLAAAKAGVKQAEINLERTKLSAPFNALLLSRSVELGSVVGPQATLATLVGTDKYWVQVSISLDLLDALAPLDRGEGEAIQARVYLKQRRAVQWEGEVVGLLGDLEQNGRMARLLVSVPEPLDQHPGYPLLLGSYVHVDLEGKALSDVVVLDRSVLRENDSLWLADQDNKLVVQPVDIVWRDADSVYISGGLKPGDRVVVSDLAIPVPGMSLLIQSDGSPAQKSTATDSPGAKAPRDEKGPGA